MNILNENDVKILNDLMSLDELGTIRYTTKLLYKYYNKENILNTDNYILAFGTMPIALVAHADTVEEQNKINLRFIYDPTKELATSIRGLGLDDKLGIFSIIKLLEIGYRPNIIITTGEERGGIGASLLTTVYKECPFNDVKYLLELDRTGYLNFVTYSNGDKEIVDYIEGNTQYRQDIGSFSDVEILGPIWKIGFVNMSIAYYYEHTHEEYVDIKQWKECINNIEILLSDINNAPKFNYIQNENDFFDLGFMDNIITCDNCGKKLTTNNYIETIDEYGISVPLCMQCAEMIAKTCVKCGNMYIPGEDDSTNKCCYCKSHKYKNVFQF